jgi:hypothetical protein
MGYDPPRIVVERNIAELATRILARQRVLAILIQRLWRGVMARRIVKYFKREVVRLRQYAWGKVLRLQRLYRGHAARLKLRGVQLARVNEKLMWQYKEERAARAEAEKKQHHAQRVKGLYKAERAVERTARFTGRVDFAGSENGYHKMKVFEHSCYSDGATAQASEELVQIQHQLTDEEKLKIQSEINRKKYIRDKVAELGPEGFGKRGEKPEGGQRIVNGFAMGPEALSS